jgi:IS30 family transposase
MIGLMKERGCSQSEIGEAIGKSQSTVSRELRRNCNSDGRYRPIAAHRKAVRRRREANSSRGYKMGEPLIFWHVLRGLGRYWSPEQISGNIRRKHPSFPHLWISHDAIYRWIWEDKKRGGEWYKKLRQGHKKYKRRARGCVDHRKVIPNRVGIEERPDVVDVKGRVGDWEGDTMLGRGRKHAVTVITERSSQYVILGKMDARNWRALNEAVGKAFGRHQESFPLPRETLTVDNGREFWGHEELGKDLGVDVYFARPYHPWERGLNEQIVGLIRQFIPKSTDLRTVTEEDLRKVEELLNNRPRKTLNYRTPLEVINEASNYAFGG